MPPSLQPRAPPHKQPPLSFQAAALTLCTLLVLLLATAVPSAVRAQGTDEATALWGQIPEGLAEPVAGGPLWRKRPAGSRVGELHTLEALPVPRPQCFYIHAEDGAKVGRFSKNIHHQSEYVLPAIEGIFQLTAFSGPFPRPLTVVSGLPLMPWSRDMMRLAAPFAVFVELSSEDTQRAVHTMCGSLDAVPRSSRVYNPRSVPYMRHSASFHLLRSAAAHVCNMEIPRPCDPERPPLTRIAVLQRHGNRKIAAPEPLLAALVEAYPKAEIAYRITHDGASLCQQIEWFTGIDLLVAGHGAALTNSVFLPAGAALVEMMPWSLALHYTVFNATLWNSGVRVKQVVAQRTLTDVFPGLQNGRYTQAECYADQPCYMWHRDQTNLVVPPAKLVAAIEEVGGVHEVCRKASGKAGL